MCKMTLIGVRLNLKNFILISSAVSQGGAESDPPNEIGLNFTSSQIIGCQILSGAFDLIWKIKLQLEKCFEGKFCQFLPE